MHLSLRKFHQQIFDGHSVEFFVFSLVCIRHQTVVAGGNAVFAGSVSTSQVFTRVRIEMANAKGFSGNFCQPVVDQSPQDASTAFGGFVKQDLTPIQIGGPPGRIGSNRSTERVRVLNSCSGMVLPGSGGAQTSGLVRSGLRTPSPVESTSLS